MNWDERIKALMEQVGMPNSRSLYQAFKQLENEVEQDRLKHAYCSTDRSWKVLAESALDLVKVTVAAHAIEKKYGLGGASNEDDEAAVDRMIAAEVTDEGKPLNPPQTSLPWPQSNPWAQAIDDALVAACLDCTTPESDPKKELARLLEWTVAIALDPTVSERAAALVKLGIDQHSSRVPLYSYEYEHENGGWFVAWTTDQHEFNKERHRNLKRWMSTPLTMEVQDDHC